MLKVKFRFSRGGFIAAGLFLLLFVVVFSWIYFIASKNPADSGESGILLLPFAMPWITLLPAHLAGLLLAFVCVFINALILYFLFGGLRIIKVADPDE
jgi:hypothetical protein